MNSSHPHSRSSFSGTSLGDFGELFPTDAPDPTPGSFNDAFVIRGIVTDSIRQCGKSRETIAEEMTYLLGATVTRRALDSYTSEAEQQNRFPTQYMRAFCHVTNDWTLIRHVTERAGFHAITRSERKLLELGRQHVIEKRAAAAIARLERELAEVAL